MTAMPRDTRAMWLAAINSKMHPDFREINMWGEIMSPRSNEMVKSFPHITDQETQAL